MPTLDDLRRWLQGEEIKGYPERDDPDAEVFSGGRLNPALMEDCPACDGEGDIQGQCCPKCQGLGGVRREKPRPSFGDRMHEKVAATKRAGRYQISADGADAILLFGKHKDTQLSDLAKSRDGRGYLRWIVGSDFPRELIDLAHDLYDWGVEKYEHGALKGKKI